MFSPRLRIALALMGVLAAGLAFLTGRWLLGSVYLLAAALFTYGLRRYGTVWRAFRAFRRGDMSTVRMWLDRVERPERLDPRHRAYYDWMRGVLAADAGDFDEARNLLNRAFENAVRTDQDRSIIHFHLAEIAHLQKDAGGSRHHLDEAKRLTRDPEMLALIAAQEERLATGS